MSLGSLRATARASYDKRKHFVGLSVAGLILLVIAIALLLFDKDPAGGACYTKDAHDAIIGLLLTSMFLPVIGVGIEYLKKHAEGKQDTAQ